MATHLNIIMPLKEFLHYTHDLQTKYGIFLYFEKRDKDKTRYVNAITDFSNMDAEIDERYRAFFLSAHPVPANTSFYDAGIFHHCIEGIGGRTMNKDVEKITLRVISKTPNATIKKFFASIMNKLRKDPTFNKGVYSSAGELYKTTFYPKSIINQYTAWLDFERKTSPIKFKP
jgi:hypothetical protein